MDMTTLRPGCDGTGAPSSKGSIMPTMSPGNRLYLYQLLRREIGTGRQTLLSRVEEVLVADDLAPEDLGYGSVREFLESLGDMVKLTVFKKGNTYATLLQNDEWDRLLAEPEGPTAQQKAAAKGKPWKHRSKAKTLRPAKPRRRRQKAAPTPEAAPAHEPVTEPEAAPTPEAAPEPEAPLEPEGAPEPANAEDVPQPIEAAAAEYEPQLEPKALRKPDPAPEPPAEPTIPPEDTRPQEADEADASPTEPQQPEEDFAEGTPVEATPIEQGQPASSPVSTPHIRLTVTYDPYAGIERDIAATERNLSEAVLETARASRPAPTAPDAAPTPAPEPVPPEPVEPQEPPRQEAPQPKQEPPSPEPTYMLVDPAEEASVEPVPVMVGLPHDFAGEVYVPNGPLSLLYQILPPSDNPIDQLAEDWAQARSTRSYEGTRNLMAFPLRAMHADGTPVTASIRRTTRPASGRHWALVAIDGNDGTKPLAEDVGPEGLPERGSAPERLLARSVDLGSWKEALAALASVAAPEPWDLPGAPGGHGILRAYLAMTFRAVLERGLLATTPRGDFGAFDTGLLSPLSEHVYACLDAGGEGDPWRLAGFSTTGEGELGSRLAELDGLPTAPAHLASFGDLFVRPGESVDLPRALAHDLGDDAHGLVAGAVRRCAADYRLVAPAVDIDTGDPCLLLPLAPLGGPAATKALAVERGADGAFVATALLDLPSAYVEARVVSRSLPDWLGKALTRVPEADSQDTATPTATHE